jgi:hypothetical protein
MEIDITSKAKPSIFITTPVFIISDGIYPIVVKKYSRSSGLFMPAFRALTAITPKTIAPKGGAPTELSLTCWSGLLTAIMSQTIAPKAGAPTMTGPNLATSQNVIQHHSRNRCASSTAFS